MDVERVSPALYERLGAHASADLVVLLDAARQEWVTDVSAAIIDRFERRLTEEISGVRLEIAGLRTEMHDGDNSLRQEIRTLRQEMRDGDAGIRQDLRDVETRLTKESLIGRHELLKWVFVFWVTQMVGIGGLVAAMVRLAA